MSKKIRLVLKDLNVESFETSMSNELKGGVPQTYATHCDGRGCSLQYCDYTYQKGQCNPTDICDFS